MNKCLRNNCQIVVLVSLKHSCVVKNTSETAAGAGKFATAVQKYCWRLNTKCN